jgi:zinc-binding alcohol dehydrogenase family protein
MNLFSFTIKYSYGRILLVKIEAISVNPVDYKQRRNTEAAASQPVILGYDAAGTVASVGSEVEKFKVDDRVFYAGDIQRPGSNATHQLVDERIVGRCPKALNFTEAAAMPLTGITAWEALFTRLSIQSEKDAGCTILIIGGAGGVGSMAIQIAKKVATLKVVATASRKDSTDWCTSLGADLCIDHHKDMKRQLEEAGIDSVPYILCLNNTDGHFESITKIIAPQGKICSIVGTSEKHALRPELFQKSVTFVWELMFTRSMFGCDDMEEQHYMLCEIADLIDSGIIQTTMRTNLGPMSIENLRETHQQLESGSTIGKIVLEGLPT